MDLAPRAAVAEQRQIGVAVRIDEPGAHDSPAGSDAAARVRELVALLPEAGGNLGVALIVKLMELERQSLPFHKVSDGLANQPGRLGALQWPRGGIDTADQRLGH